MMNISDNAVFILFLFSLRTTLHLLRNANIYDIFTIKLLLRKNSIYKYKINDTLKVFTVTSIKGAISEITIILKKWSRQTSKLCIVYIKQFFPDQFGIF